MDGGPQQVSATAVADYATGIAIAWAICAALFARERKGVGQRIDTSLLSTALSVQGSFFELDQYTKDTRLEFLETIDSLRAAQVPYQTLLDQQIEMASIDTPTDTYADTGGIKLKGTTDKTLQWSNTTKSWEITPKLQQKGQFMKYSTHQSWVLGG